MAFKKLHVGYVTCSSEKNPPHAARVVPKRAQSFGIQVIAYDPSVSEEKFLSLDVRKVSFEQLIEQSDFISSHLPLLPNTAHLFNKEVFKQIKKTAFIVNTSRGGVVHSDDLVEVSNGTGMDFTVLESKGLDIVSMRFKGVNLNFSPKSGLVAPSLVDMNGNEFMRSISGGMLYTCGLTGHRSK